MCPNKTIAKNRQSNELEVRGKQQSRNWWTDETMATGMSDLANQQHLTISEWN